MFSSTKGEFFIELIEGSNWFEWSLYLMLLVYIFNIIFPTLSRYVFKWKKNQVLCFKFGIFWLNFWKGNRRFSCKFEISECCDCRTLSAFFRSATHTYPPLLWGLPVDLRFKYQFIMNLFLYFLARFLFFFWNLARAPRVPGPNSNKSFFWQRNNLIFENSISQKRWSTIIQCIKS